MPRGNRQCNGLNTFFYAQNDREHGDRDNQGGQHEQGHHSRGHGGHGGHGMNGAATSDDSTFR